MMKRKIGIGWQVGGTTGWGVYGQALMMQAARRRVLPVPFYVSPSLCPDPIESRILLPLQTTMHIERELLALTDGPVRTPYPFLLGLGNDLTPADSLTAWDGTPSIGVVFFEHRKIATADMARARDRFAAIVAGSSWNADVLRDLGFPHVVFCPQGVDLTRFHPAPRSGALSDRFVVFSGGKLEFRKGQDIVIEAFRRFHAHHPDALLMVSWHNHWDQSVDSIRLSPHGLGAPQRDGDCWRMADWLAELGVPPDAVMDLGEVDHHDMPRLLRECDVGVFPNRCEGGTNLVAMECMACGVPVILSRNTGHFDLLTVPGAALPLENQAVVHGGVGDDPGLFVDWGESDPDEIVAHLKWAYQNRDKAAAVGAAGAAFMQSWSWPDKIDALLQGVGCI